MTENKRFTQIDEDDWEILDRNKHFAYAHSGYQAEKIIQELNELVETNRELYKENKKLEEENEQLKQRNDRQAKRLAELYELMAKKDWESLTEIIDDFCSCEEQLQRESRTYGEWE